VLTVALGYVAARQRWLGQPGEGDPARLLSNAAFYLFVPALLVRTTVRLDLAHLPWGTVIAFFAPVLLVLLGAYLAARWRGGAGGAAAPAVRAITATFGNSVQVGIPLAAAIFGEGGLAIHIALVSLHALLLLSVLTALVELDLARARHAQGEGAALRHTLLLTARNTVIHPVVLPVLVGLLWNVSGYGLPPVLDDALATLSAAVVPLCLVLIGVNLENYGLKGHIRGALGGSLLKLLVLPALVLLMGRWIFGIEGLPLAVIVMMAALPVGSNALIFAERYDSLQAETTAAIVVSTVAFAATSTLWLAVLALMGALPQT
jgi:malonate transporter and related proteins